MRQMVLAGCNAMIARRLHRLLSCPLAWRTSSVGRLQAFVTCYLHGDPAFAHCICRCHCCEGPSAYSGRTAACRRLRQNVQRLAADMAAGEQHSCQTL